MNQVQDLLVKINSSIPFHLSVAGHCHRFRASELFKAIPSSLKSLPSNSKETFYLRDPKSGAVLWIDQNGNPQIRGMEPFHADCLWRYCPLSSGLKGGLLMAAGRYDVCLGINTKSKEISAIDLCDASINEMWEYDFKTSEWTCPNGKLFHQLYDHSKQNGLIQWNEYQFEPVPTKLVNQVLQNEGLSWDQELGYLPSFLKLD